MIWYIPKANFDRSDCLPLLKCRGMGNLRKFHWTGHNTMHTIQWKRWLREYERFTNMLKFGTLRAIRLSEMVMTLFRISLYIHDVKSLSADPYMCFLRSHTTWHTVSVKGRKWEIWDSGQHQWEVAVISCTSSFVWRFTTSSITST